VYARVYVWQWRLQESSDLNTKMFLPEASAVQAQCTKCKKAKKGIVLVCVCVCAYTGGAGFKYCRVMMKHGRTEAVQEAPKSPEQV
jgi:hypothetical protein